MAIAHEQFMAILKKHGIRGKKQAAFTKVAIGTNAMYIANTQKVSRVDISGFVFSHPAVHKLTDEEKANGKTGRVLARLDFTRTDDRVLEAFETAITKMQQLAKEAETEAKSTSTKRAKAGAKAGRKPRGAQVQAETDQANA